MGIDIYLHWSDMTQQDREAQITGYEVSGRAGSIGYLREADHGTPYATKVLMPEAFDDEDRRDENYIGTLIPVHVLRERLPTAIETAHERGRTVYGDPKGYGAMANVLEAFVAKAEELAAAGKIPRVLARIHRRDVAMPVRPGMRGKGERDSEGLVPPRNRDGLP